MLLDAEDDRRLTFKTCITPLDCRGKSYVGNLTQQNRLTILGGQSKVHQVIQAGSPSDVPDKILATVELQKAPRSIGGEALQGTFQLVMSDAQFSHADCVRLYLELTHLATDGDNLRHSGDSHQPRAQHPVGVFPDGHRRHFLDVDWNGDLHDFTHDGTNGAHTRHDALRKCLLH